jgi:hypothetical protein
MPGGLQDAASQLRSLRHWLLQVEENPLRGFRVCGWRLRRRSCWFESGANFTVGLRRARAVHLANASQRVPNLRRSGIYQIGKPTQPWRTGLNCGAPLALGRERNGRKEKARRGIPKSTQRTAATYGKNLLILLGWAGQK